MNSPILVKLRNDQGKFYGSYSVLHDLIDLSGMPWIDQTEFNIESPGLFIVAAINGNTLAWARDSRRKCKLYAIQIERWLSTAEDFAPAGFDRMFIADRYQANSLSHLPYVRYMPIGGHPDLGKPAIEKKYDLVPLCYRYGQREEKIQQIAAAGWSIAPNGFGSERNRILSASRAGLCLHQAANDPSLNPLRACIFSCFRLPLIFEYVRDPFPFSAYSTDEIATAIRDERGYAETNFKRMTEEFEFRRVIEEACRD